MKFPEQLEIRVFTVLCAIATLMAAVSFLFFAPGIYSCGDIVFTNTGGSFDQKMLDDCNSRRDIGNALLMPIMPPMFAALMLFSAFYLIAGLQFPEGIPPLFQAATYLLGLVFAAVQMAVLSFLACALWRFLRQLRNAPAMKKK